MGITGGQVSRNEQCAAGSRARMWKSRGWACFLDSGSQDEGTCVWCVPMCFLRDMGEATERVTMRGMHTYNIQHECMHYFRATYMYVLARNSCMTWLTRGWHAVYVWNDTNAQTHIHNKSPTRGRYLSCICTCPNTHAHVHKYLYFPHVWRRTCLRPYHIHTYDMTRGMASSYALQAFKWSCTHTHTYTHTHTSTFLVCVTPRAPTTAVFTRMAIFVHACDSRPHVYMAHQILRQTSSSALQFILKPLHHKLYTFTPLTHPTRNTQLRSTWRPKT